MYESTVPVLTQLLRNIDAWLEEAIAFAEGREMDPETLLTARLYPDMFDLRRQVQNACDAAKFVGARLTGIDAPKHEDGPQTLAELRGRIAEVSAFLEGLDEAAFEGAETRELAPGFLKGMATTGAHYTREFAMPNTYFHACMTYAILRSVGVKLGKRQFIGNMTLYKPE